MKPLHERFYASAAYQTMQPLRIPSGWRIAWNALSPELESDQSEHSTIWDAVNEAHRFNVNVHSTVEQGRRVFHLEVLYQPWRRDQGGRRKSEALVFDGNAESVHRGQTEDYAHLIRELEEWIARCSAWQREQN